MFKSNPNDHFRQGQSWSNCRSVLNVPLLKSVFVSAHVPTMDELAWDATRLLEFHPVERDIHETMYLWALESELHSSEL